MAFTLEPAGANYKGPCSCCGELTSRIWGYVYEDDTAIAAYFVEWTPCHEPLSANFDLLMGSRGDNTSSADRFAVALAFRRLPSGPAFMVVDAGVRSAAKSPLISSALTREGVIGTSLAQPVFSIVDAIYLSDPRLEELCVPRLEDPMN